MIHAFVVVAVVALVAAFARKAFLEYTSHSLTSLVVDAAPEFRRPASDVHAGTPRHKISGAYGSVYVHHISLR